jgi:hypothetical protein
LKYSMSERHSKKGAYIAHVQVLPEVGRAENLQNQNYVLQRTGKRKPKQFGALR